MREDSLSAATWTLVRTAAILVLLAPACQEAPTWEQTMAAGQQAAAQGHYADAERLFLAALKRAEAGEAADANAKDERLALTLAQLGQVMQAQRKFDQAELHYGQALRHLQTVRGSAHPDVAALLNNLGVLHRMHGQYAEAEPLLRRALAIKEKALGPEDPDVALALNNLGMLYHTQGRYEQAEPLFKRALAIREKALGPRHVDVARSLDDYADLLRKTNRGAEAEPLVARAAAIRAAQPAGGGR